MICLHGWGGCCDSFLGIAKKLWNEYRVTLVDFYGFGLTPHPEVPLTLDDYVLSIVEIIRHYKMDKVTLICHSFGGRVGMMLAAKYPYYVKKLILADVAGVKPHRGIRYFIKIYSYKLFKKLKIKWNAGSRDYNNLPEKMRGTFINIVNMDLTPYLHKIMAKTLIIWGNKDKETPIYMARRLHKKIPENKLVVFCGCGHFAYVERHNVFCDMVESFLIYDGENHSLDRNGNSVFDGKRNVIKIPVSKSK